MGDVHALVSTLGLQPGTISGWVLVAAVMLALVKAWPALKKLRMEEDGSMRGDLFARITRLENEAREERLACAQQLSDLRKDYENRIAAMARQMDALQRELFNLRHTALGLSIPLPDATIDELGRKVAE